MSQRKQQKKKENHWVAQAYLRVFSVDPSQSKEKRKIWRLSKNMGDPELKPIRKVAVKFYLYAPYNADNSRDYAFEDKLASLDELFANPLWTQIATDSINLCDESVRKLAALQMAVMYLRNPTQFEEHKSVHKEIVKFLNRAYDLPTSFKFQDQVYEIDRSTWPAYRDANEDCLKRNWIRRVESASGIAELFINMRWSVVVADTPAFITTDNPVTFIHPSLQFRGLKDQNTSVLFPLSPTRVLILDHKKNEPDGQYYPLPKGGAAAINGLLWRNSNEYMFSSRDPDIVCAEMVKFDSDS